MRVFAPFSVVSLLPLVFAGCAADLSIDAEAALLCQTQDDCPESHRCEVGIGFCLPNDPGGPGPQIATASAEPAILGRSQTTTLSVTFDRTLLTAPSALLRLPSGDRALAGLGGSGAGPWRFAYTAAGDEATETLEVEVPMVVTAYDTGGRVSRDSSAASVIFDFVPPPIEGVTALGTRPVGERLWVDSSTVTFAVDILDSADPPTTMVLGGDLATPGESLFASDVDVKLSTGNGRRSILFSFFDAVGNVATASTDLFVDTGVPSASVTVAELGKPHGPSLEVWLNADSMPFLFALQGPVSPDFVSFALARGANSFIDIGGTQLESVPVCPPSLCPSDPSDSALCFCPDETTVFRLAERDVFANFTPPEQQATLTLHEDSIAPGPLVPMTHFITGSLTSDVGVVALSTDDLADTGLVFEVFGGSLGQATLSTAPPLVRLPAVGPGETVAYSVRAKDLAGNGGPIATIIVADDPVTTMLGGGAADCVGNCVRTGFRTGNQLSNVTAARRLAFYDSVRDTDGDIIEHALGLCSYNASTTSYACTRQTFTCPWVSAPGPLCSTRYVVQDLGVSPRALFWNDITANFPSDRALRRMPVASDGTLAAASTTPIATNTAWLGVRDNAIVFGRQVASTCARGICVSTMRLCYRALDSAGVPAGSDTILTVGSTPVPGPSITSTGRIDFSGRYILYPNGSGIAQLLDLGADAVPGGSGVNAEVLTSLSPLPYYRTRLIGGRLFIYDAEVGETTVRDLGANGRYDASGGDDVVTNLGAISVLGGASDKLVVTGDSGSPDLFDMSSKRRLGAHNLITGIGPAAYLDVVPGFLVGAVEVPGAGVPQPALASAATEPFAYRMGSVVRGLPGGVLSELAIALPSPDLVFSRLGGLSVSLEIPEMSDRGPVPWVDVDSDDELVVWIDEAGNAQVYSLGPDGRAGPGTSGGSDDVGPIALTSAGFARWPRVSDGVIVFSELLDEATDDGDWTGVLDAALLVLDLGPDRLPSSSWDSSTGAWVLGGDDIGDNLTTRAGGLAAWPDIEGRSIAYFDYADDPTDRCELSARGTPPSDCTPAVRFFSLDDDATPTAIAGSVAPRAGLLAAPGHLTYSEFNGTDWDAKIVALSPSPVVDTVGGVGDQMFPVLAGAELVYLETLDFGSYGGLSTALRSQRAGIDGAHGTSDDIILRDHCQPLLQTCLPVLGSVEELLGGPRYTWAAGGQALLGDALWPIEEAVDFVSRTNLDLPIPDGVGALSDSVELVVPDAVWVESMVVEVSFFHSSPAQTSMTLTSPSGDVASLAFSATVLLGTLPWKIGFSTQLTPELFDHWGEPAAGTWTLSIQDSVVGTSGTLVGWSITHRR